MQTKLLFKTCIPILGFVVWASVPFWGGGIVLAQSIAYEEGRSLIFSDGITGGITSGENVVAFKNSVNGIEKPATEMSSISVNSGNDLALALAFQQTGEVASNVDQATDDDDETQNRFLFSVSPGLSLNGAYFGYRFGNLTAFAGLNAIGSSFRYRESIEGGDSYEVEVKLRVFLPVLGANYFLLDRGPVKGYAGLSFSKAFHHLRFYEDGERVSEFEEAFDDFTLWVFKPAVGMQYFLSDNFSIGGEVGLNMIVSSEESEFTRSEFDPDTGEIVTRTYNYEWRSIFSIMQNTISMNFYF